MAESRVHSFPPLLGQRPRLLILGSMPGVASLAAQQYYAHPRNAFWPILCSWCGIAAELPYRHRVEALLQAGIAVWDVLAHCQRPGSLDSAIDLTTAQPNAIAELLQEQPGIIRICFNGAAAADLYRRHRLPAAPPLQLIRLPSTSPAHAGMALAEKAREWHQALAG
ncbi:MAG: DNA-deoxyinosine glycosylase [Lysobacterales bacterium]